MKSKFISGYHQTAHGKFDEKGWLNAFKDESITINEIREESALTQKELADLSGCGLRSIKRWEQQKSPANLAVCKACEGAKNN